MEQDAMTAQAAEYQVAAERVFAGDPAPTENPLFSLGTEMMAEFADAQRLRYETEQRWLNDLRQYKGVYEPDEEAKMTGSKAFLRKTRIKVESVDARLMDLLFPANRLRNWAITSTPKPTLPEAIKATLVAAIEQATGQPATPDAIDAAVKAYADEAATKMGDRVDDQLTEARYRNVCREVIHSGHLYGTGILKGPLVEHRTRVSYVWEEASQRFVLNAERFSAPFLAHVPVWRWYPDLAVTELKDCRYAWEHHRLSRADMAGLADRASFDGAAIRSYLDANPDGAMKLMTYESGLRAIKDETSAAAILTRKSGLYDVYERWGWLNGDRLRACGLEIHDDRLHEAFFSNMWVLPDGRVIKAILAPIDGVTWPYHLYYLEKDETSLFADGFPAIMRDDQTMINASVRMLLDNAAWTAGPQFEVFVPAFPANADLTTMYPGKVWPRVSGDFAYPAVRELRFDSHMPELVSVLQLFDANADETTAIPKFTYGDNPRNGAAGTMGGLSMLLGQANIALKDLVTSFDEGITKSFIGAMYHWNMRFSIDNAIKGDFDVAATGAASLVAKEVRGAMLASFGATLQPEERARVKWGDLLRQKAEAQDLSNVVMDDQEFEAEMAKPENQAAGQLAQATQQLQLALLQAKVAEANSKAMSVQADAIGTKMDAILTAMQAAGLAIQNPAISTAGDSMLASAGWPAPNQPNQPDQPGQPGPDQAGAAPAPMDVPA